MLPDWRLLALPACGTHGIFLMPTHGIEDENLCSFVRGMFSANMTATPVAARLHGPSYVAQRRMVEINSFV